MRGFIKESLQFLQGRRKKIFLMQPVCFLDPNFALNRLVMSKRAYFASFRSYSIFLVSRATKLPTGRAVVFDASLALVAAQTLHQLKVLLHESQKIPKKSRFLRDIAFLTSPPNSTRKNGPEYIRKCLDRKYFDSPAEIARFRHILLRRRDIYIYMMSTEKKKPSESRFTGKKNQAFFETL